MSCAWHWILMGWRDWIKNLKGSLDIGQENAQLPDGPSTRHVLFGFRSWFHSPHESIRQPVHSSRDGARGSYGARRPAAIATVANGIHCRETSTTPSKGFLLLVSCCSTASRQQSRAHQQNDDHYTSLTSFFSTYKIHSAAVPFGPTGRGKQINTKVRARRTETAAEECFDAPSNSFSSFLSRTRCVIPTGSDQRKTSLPPSHSACF